MKRGKTRKGEGSAARNSSGEYERGTRVPYRKEDAGRRTALAEATAGFLLMSLLSFRKRTRSDFGRDESVGFASGFGDGLSDGASTPSGSVSESDIEGGRWTLATAGGNVLAWTL